MNGFISFMASPAGRWARVFAGLALIVVGALLAGLWWILAAVGLVPLLAGALDVCVFAPLLSLPFAGTKIRQNMQA
ncbi:MAG TPA: YgaP-like transmembrane domain [Acidothermaceae bacterium]